MGKGRDMRIILSGQRSFGAAVLGLLRERGDDVLAVYAPHDGKLATAAGLARVPWRLAGTLRHDTMPPEPDLIIAAHSHDFIGRRSRAACRYGAIGYHPSLLPRHRGRDAVRWTVLMGDPIAGGTVFWLSDTVDGGPIAKQDWCMARPGDGPSEIWRRDLFPMGVRLLAEVLQDLDANRVVRVPQDQELATWEPSFDGAPRLFRPELAMIGDAGYRVTADPSAAKSAGQ